MTQKIAVIGHGYWGKNHARVFKELGVLSGVYDLNIENIESSKFNLFNNLDELINNSTAAVIATPATTHFEIANKLIEELDLLIEKPMSMSANECKQLNHKAKVNNKIIMIGHQLHFHPAIQKIKSQLNDDVIGDIKWIYSNRLNMGKIRNKENVLWSFAPHDISLILDIVNSDVKSINIQGSKVINNDVEDATLTGLTFENGVKGHIFVSWFHPFKEQRFVVVGEKGTFVFTDSDQENKLLIYKTTIDNDNLSILDHNSSIVEYENSEPLKNQGKYFLDSLLTRKCLVNNGTHGEKVVEVLEESSKLL